MHKRTKGKCPKEQRDGGHTKGWILILIDECYVLVLLCRRPISRQKKEREEANSKNLKKRLDTKRKKRRDIPQQNLSLQNDSNTRARIKEQQERGRSFERAKASENSYSGFLSKRREEKTDLLFIFL